MMRGIPAENTRMPKPSSLAWLLVTVLAAHAAPPAAAQAPETSGYDQPPREILDVLHAPSPPRPYVSPTSDTILLVSWVDYPPMSRVATPFLRLAGVRVE